MDVTSPYQTRLVSTGRVSAPLNQTKATFATQQQQLREEAGRGRSIQICGFSGW